MEDQLLLHLYHRLFDPGKAPPPPTPPPPPRPGGCVYGDAIVALVYFLSVLRQRSVRWAHDRRNWPLWMRRLRCPGYSQLMRRLKTRSVLTLVAALNLEFRSALPEGTDKFCDGKPLTVGGFSKDPDARRGKVPAGWARGYKVHVIVDACCGAIDLFAVTGLDAGEPTVMCRLAALADLKGAVLRGDSSYDSDRLYRAVDAAGGRLIAPRKKPGTGLGHGREFHPHRLLAIHQLEQSDESLRAHRRRRIRVEQALGHATNLPFGLAPLPNFVRRLRRVALWVLGKVTLYHLYLKLRRQHALAA